MPNTNMTEQEWLQCADPEPMLAFLGQGASERKLRLFGCACCQRIWRLFSDERSRNALKVVECFADGLPSAEEMAAARDATNVAVMDGDDARCEAYTLYREDLSPAKLRAVVVTETTFRARVAVNAITDIRPHDFVWSAALAVGCEAEIPIPITDAEDARKSELAHDTAVAAESAAQADLLRDIFGNPIRPVTLAENWLTWNDGAVVALAQAIYDERTVDRLPILADALEEAGCGDAQILNHCRGPGPHALGCWVVDLVLGKE